MANFLKKEMATAIGLIIVSVISIFTIKSFGWRYAGIAELNRLEKRVMMLEDIIILKHEIEKGVDYQVDADQLALTESVAVLNIKSSRN